MLARLILIRGRFLVLAIVALGAMPSFAERFVHPAGAEFDYPDSWYLRALDAALLLLPPESVSANANKDYVQDEAPNRFMLVGAEPVSAGVMADHPAVAAFFDSQVASAIPGSQRQSWSFPAEGVGELEYVSESGRRTVLKYRLQAGLGLYVAQVVETKTVVTDRVFEELFDSYTVQLKVDIDLLGSWYRSTTSSSDVDYDANSGGASYVSASAQKQYTFGRDNRFSYESASQVYAQGTGLAGLSSAGDSAPDAGIYSATGEVLTLTWDDGDIVACLYNLFEKYDGHDALAITCDGGSKRFFTRSD